MFAIICVQGDAMKVVAKTIDTIVVFRGGSKPLPYKFRYTDGGGQSREVLVGHIFLAEQQKSGGVPFYIYECQSTIDGRARRYQLKYRIPDCRWELYKM